MTTTPKLSDLAKVWLDENHPEGWEIKSDGGLYNKHGWWFGHFFNDLAEFRCVNLDNASVPIIIKAADPDFFVKLKECMEIVKDSRIALYVKHAQWGM